ncbi:MAG: DUF362 domain-containing protein [Armatimonadota bacterium]|nr:DUF362 domain-containing protein [Armatimonadota bacterium]
MSRQEWWQWLSVAGLAAIAGCARRQSGSHASQKPLSSAKAEHLQKVQSLVTVASKGTPRDMVERALRPLGGIEKFVRPGDTVVLKPNAAWLRTPEQAANTNPEVVAAVIELCKRAGAKRILIVEHTCDNPATACFEMSGIRRVAEAGGAVIVNANAEGMYVPVSVPGGKVLHQTEVARDVLEADCFINLPVAKDHSATRVTLGLKNLMGVVWERQSWHVWGVHECIGDFALAVKPHLTIVDATRILATRGPKGPGEVRRLNQIITGVDPVAVDAFAATLFGLRPEDIGYIMHAHRLGVGEARLNRLNITRV